MWTIYKTKRKNTKIKKTGDLRDIYQNEIYKVCFPHDMVDGVFKHLTRKVAAVKDRALYNRWMESCLYSVFTERFIRTVKNKMYKYLTSI